ncbi:MAG: aminotransferase class V-fold PLP-dependent enzyme [Clostridiales bacterium]|nr:aminotransferase class V-fold PLP-dependent enzyme [Clostridiales bacterium]
MNIEKLRSYFPVTQSYTFLNNAAESPMNLVYREALDQFYDIACDAPQNKPDIRWIVREKLSELLGGLPEDYALITSTGVGSGIVAAGFDFKAGDNVVIPENEHRNNLFPWLALKDKGVEIRFVPVAENGHINYEDINALVDENTRIVSIAAVRFNSGFRADLKKISSIAHAKGALLFVDAIQAAGVVPIHVEKMGIDIMSSAGFKWLLGIPGTGFLYVNEKARALIHPVIPGMFAAENSVRELKFFKDSRKYETGSIAYSLFYAWQEGLDLLHTIGIENIYRRVLELTDLLIEGLKDREIKIMSSIKNRNERSAILFCSLGDESVNIAFEEKLKENNIIIAVRDGKCRISPNFFNTKNEIDHFFEVLDDAIRQSIK